MTMTPEDLISFEREVAEHFNAGRIRAPIHLSGGNEHQLVSYFADRWRPGDWVCTSWRSHYHCLLAGVPPQEVMAAILAGRSITLTFPEHRVISSAIVGGIIPVALGLALSVSRGEALPPAPSRVHCFVGDMTARTGTYREALEYASGHALPLSFIIEDNGKSVMTPTKKVWGDDLSPPVHEELHVYELPWPHAGAGVRVQF